MLLTNIKSPDDVKKLSEDKLPQLAQEIRDRLIQSLSETGGHLGPNLGVVELTIALHRVFNTPEDKFTFDVSHQGYVHKLLTGREKDFHTIRTYEGLNGFLLRTESEHDAYGAGHAGTAISAALGMAKARDLVNGDNHVVSVAGDAAFTCGSTLEALNNVAQTTDKMIIVLNDNEWSIDRNVGAVAKIFNDIQTHPAYDGIRDKASEWAKKLVGDSGKKFLKSVEGSAKNLLLPNMFFEEFGIRYFGPIDGHDLPLLIKTFEYLKKQDQPVILHIITEKGKGYKPALDNPGKFHGLGAYKVEDGSTSSTSAPTYSEVFARTVTDIAHQDKEVVSITAAMPGGTKLEIFKNEIPDRYFDVGIAEGHAALFASGLACEGIKPFLAIYSTFMQRAYDMIIHDIALQKLPVRLCMDRAGLSGDDGPTHHGLFDIGYLRHVPDLIMMQPKDEAEFYNMLHWMADYNEGPTAIRYPRGGGVNAPIPEKPEPLELGKAEIIQKGSDVLLLGLGNLLEMAMETKELLEAKGYSVAVINPRFIKPLDEKTILDLASKVKVVCTFEDHSIKNGFGTSVLELLYEKGNKTPLEIMGWPDEFVDHGKVPILREKYGLTAQHALARILSNLEN